MCILLTGIRNTIESHVPFPISVVATLVLRCLYDSDKDIVSSFWEISCLLVLQTHRLARSQLTRPMVYHAHNSYHPQPITSLALG